MFKEKVERSLCREKGTRRICKKETHLVLRQDFERLGAVNKHPHRICCRRDILEHASGNESVKTLFGRKDLAKSHHPRCADYNHQVRVKQNNPPEAEISGTCVHC